MRRWHNKIAEERERVLKYLSEKSVGVSELEDSGGGEWKKKRPTPHPPGELFCRGVHAWWSIYDPGAIYCRHSGTPCHRATNESFMTKLHQWSRAAAPHLAHCIFTAAASNSNQSTPNKQQCQSFCGCNSISLLRIMLAFTHCRLQKVEYIATELNSICGKLLQSSNVSWKCLPKAALWPIFVEGRWSKSYHRWSWTICCSCLQAIVFIKAQLASSASPGLVLSALVESNWNWSLWTVLEDVSPFIQEASAVQQLKTAVTWVAENLHGLISWTYLQLWCMFSSASCRSNSAGLSSTSTKTCLKSLMKK